MGKRSRKQVGNKLRLVTDEGWVGGVCAGLAYYFEVPAWAVRLVVFILVFGYGFSVVPYVLLWILMPAWDRTPEGYDEVTGH